MNQPTSTTNLADPASASAAEPNAEDRRLHANNVGLPRTGTESISGIFGHFSAGHEVLEKETMRAITEYTSGRIDDAAFEQFVIDRARLENLEMDSSSYSSAYLPILVRRFPEAKFLFIICDCHSWLNSTINLTYEILANLFLPHWWIDYGTSLGLDVNPAAFSSQEGFCHHLEDVVDGLLRYWATGNAKALANLPPERSLVLKTNEIASNIPATSILVSVPQNQLLFERSHLHKTARNKTARNFSLLDRLKPSAIQQSVDHYCRPLMEQYFPAELNRRAANNLYCSNGPNDVIGFF